MDYTYRRRLGEGGSDNDDDDEITPHFRNLSVTNLTATRAVVAGSFAGLPASEIEGIELTDVTVFGGWGESSGGKGPQFKCRNATGTAIRVVPDACF